MTEKQTKAGLEISKTGESRTKTSARVSSGYAQTRTRSIAKVLSGK